MIEEFQESLAELRKKNTCNSFESLHVSRMSEALMLGLSKDDLSAQPSINVRPPSE